jgi:hypothetical protein
MVNPFCKQRGASCARGGVREGGGFASAPPSHAGVPPRPAPAPAPPPPAPPPPPPPPLSPPPPPQQQQQRPPPPRPPRPPPPATPTHLRPRRSVASRRASPRVTAARRSRARRGCATCAALPAFSPRPLPLRPRPRPARAVSRLHLGGISLGRHAQGASARRSPAPFSFGFGFRGSLPHFPSPSYKSQPLLQKSTPLSREGKGGEVTRRVARARLQRLLLREEPRLHLHYLCWTHSFHEPLRFLVVSCAGGGRQGALA